MQTFTDDNGNEWQIAVNTWTLRKVKENAGVLLTDLAENNFLLYAQLHSDPILCGDVVWPLVQEQAESRGMDLRAFLEAFSGDVIGRARDAVIEATVDFFDDPAKRRQVRDLLAKVQATATVMRTKVAEEIQALDPNSAAESFTNSLSNSQGSLA